MTEHFPDKAGVIAPPPLIYFGTLIVGLLLQWVFPATVLPIEVARVVGVICIALFIVIGFPAIMLMRRSGTSLRPDEPTTALVTSGSFRYTRNPIYVSMALLYLGVTLLVNALWPLLLLLVALVVIDRGVIAREERYLERKFGAEYAQYKARVRRWL